MATARRDKTYDLSIVLAVLANVDTLFCLDQYFCSLRQKSLEGASIKYVRAEGEGGVKEMPNFAYG